MKAKTLALFARNEIRGCRQAEPIGDHCVELFMDPFDFQRADITAFCTRYHAYVDDTAFTDDYIAYFLRPTERSFFRPDKRKQISFKLQRDVDADLIEWLESQPNIHEYLRDLIRSDMTKGDLPVRCKDCINWDTDWEPRDCEADKHFCYMVDHPTAKDFYCADAERKNHHDS